MVTTRSICMPWMLAVVFALPLWTPSARATEPAPVPAPAAAKPAPAPATATAAAAKPPGSPAGGGAWKDLQVLPKNISKDELKKIMKSMSKDLGVDCSFCHDEPNMEKDTNKKKLAREMMQMTSEISRRYPSTMKKVTCWTCHRGKEEPDKRQ